MDASTLGIIFSRLLTILFWIVILDVIFSWVVAMGKISSFHPIPKTLTNITSPLLNPIRQIIPAYRTGGIDLSPMILCSIIQVIRALIRF